MTAEQLRKSILQYAIQGKLVPQIETEEPAKELLKKIKEEKEKLIKEGKIRKEKSLPEITENDIPFEIPSSWVWVRLGFIGDWRSGSTPIRDNPLFYKNGTIPWLKTGDLNDGYITYIPENITELALTKTSVRLNPIGSILIAMYGATIGKLGILTFEATTNQACCACFPINGIYNLYLFYYLLSQKSELQKRSEGGAQPNISREKIISYLFPLPPLAEQQRIVERIEQLMAMVDEYEKHEKELDIFEKEFPDKLKKSILQYAVQGKLVPQIETEEPASGLLKKVQEEKEKLIKEGKLKKEKPLPEIMEDEIPFEIPNSWEWVRLGDVLHKLTDGTHTTPKYTTKGMPFLSVKDMSNGEISFDDTKYISIEEHNELYKRCNPEKGDVLLTKVGTTGIPVLVDTEKQFSLFVSVALLKFNQQYIFNKYLINLINSPLVKQQCIENTKGVGNKNLVLRDIAKSLIPLPPLAEQQRIVERTEQLFEIIDKM